MPINIFADADTPAPARLAMVALLALAGSALTIGAAEAAPPNATYAPPAISSSESCIEIEGAIVCSERWGGGSSIPRIIHVPGPQTETEAAYSSERERRWHNRCRPTVREDRYGVGRYVYAAAGCEFGRTED